MLEQLWPPASLDIILLALSFVAFLAGIVAFIYEEFSCKAANTDGHMCHESLDLPKDVADLKELTESKEKTPKVAEPEQLNPKAREDLPEPEPEGCDEEGKKFQEVILERIPGEAWGLCWHRTAFDEERLIFTGVDPNTPAGLWQQERKAQGLPLLERGDELICVNDLSQHSGMKMVLVVSNRLRLKFLRSDWVIPGEDVSEAIKEEAIKEDDPVPKTLEEGEIEDDTEENSAQYNGLQLNFWSYQRPPRAIALTADVAQTTFPVTPSPPHLRARSDPPKTLREAAESADELPLPSPSRPSEPRVATSPARGTRETPATRKASSTRRVRSTSAAHGKRTEAHEVDSQIFSGEEHSDAQCPSTDWEYMMDNRDGQAMTTAANGSVVLVAGSQAYALQTAAGVMPCGGLLPAPNMPLQHPADMPGMQEVSNLAQVPGFEGAMTVPMNGFQGMYSPTSGSGAMVGWNYWQAAPQHPEMMAAPQEVEMQRSASPPRSKKTYRAGQRLTARRLRAAQRAATEQAPADSEASDGAEAVEGSTRTKPRRRAGVRVRRRREHALKRREAAEQGQAAEPLPPGLRDAPSESVTAQNEASRDGGASSKAPHPTRPSIDARCLPPAFTAEQKQECNEFDIIGEKVLINGLVQAPHLNGHWGHVTGYDAAQRRYAVQLVGASLLLHLRREALVLPKTSPPGPEELRGNWQPNLRM